MEKQFKINLWSSWKFLAGIILVLEIIKYILGMGYDGIETRYATIVFLIAVGFKNIEDKLNIETNAINFKYKTKKKKEDNDWFIKQNTFRA